MLKMPFGNLASLNVHSGTFSSRIATGSLATCCQKNPLPPPKKGQNEWKIFYLIAPFNQAFLIRLQCLLDGAVRSPSTGADAHLSSHVVLSRLRSVWRRACALIYSVFGLFLPSPPPPFHLPFGSLYGKKEKEKGKKKTAGAN